MHYIGEIISEDSHSNGKAAGLGNGARYACRNFARRELWLQRFLRILNPSANPGTNVAKTDMEAGPRYIHRPFRDECRTVIDTEG